MSVMTFLMISMVPNSPQSKRGLPRVFREQCCTPGASVGAQIRSCGSDRVLYRYPHRDSCGRHIAANGIRCQGSRGNVSYCCTELSRKGRIHRRNMLTVPSDAEAWAVCSPRPRRSDEASRAEQRLMVGLAARAGLGQELIRCVKVPPGCPPSLGCWSMRTWRPATPRSRSTQARANPQTAGQAGAAPARDRLRRRCRHAPAGSRIRRHGQLSWHTVAIPFR
jgi:hypothetical protein